MFILKTFGGYQSGTNYSKPMYHCIDYMYDHELTSAAENQRCRLYAPVNNHRSRAFRPFLLARHTARNTLALECAMIKFRFLKRNV